MQCSMTGPPHRISRLLLPQLEGATEMFNLVPRPYSHAAFNVDQGAWAKVKAKVVSDTMDIDSSTTHILHEWGVGDHGS